jgi:hypothetical protein
LAGNLSQCVSNLFADVVDSLAAQAADQLLADGNTLLIGKAGEHLLGIARSGILAGFGCDSSEKDSGKGTSLSMAVAHQYFFSTETKVWLVLCRTLTSHHTPGVESRATYYCVLCASKLFGQSHKQDIWSVLNPVIIELVFRLGSDGVVGSAQSAEQLRKRGVDLGR